MPLQDMLRVRTTLSGWVGGPGLATFYFNTDDPTGPGTLTEAQSVADHVHAAWANMLNMFPAFMRIDVQPTVDVIQDMTGGLVASHVTSGETQISGDAGGLALPQATMLCMNLLTLDIIDGHRVRGRSFVGPLKQVGDADGTPTSSQLTQMAEFGTDLRVGPNPLVVWHRPKGASAGKSCLVTGHITKDRFAVLRSRRG